MMQVAKPSPLPDGKLLSVELSREFPEVPDDVIKEIMERNANNRELCLEALHHECQRYQENLYGVPSLGQQPEGHLDFPDNNVDTIYAHQGSPDSSSIGSASNLGAERRDATPASESSSDVQTLPQDRPNMYLPQSPYASPVPVPSSDFPGRSPQNPPVSTFQQPNIFSNPFVSMFRPGDARFYGHRFPRMPGEPFGGGAFGERPKTFDPFYGPFPIRNFPPFMGGNMMLSPMMGMPRPGARSPLPGSSPQTPGYPVDPGFNASTVDRRCGGGLNAEGPPSLVHQMSQQMSGSNNTFGSPYRNPQEMLIGPQHRLQFQFGAFSLDNLAPTSQASVPLGSGSATSSRSGSLTGEEDYARALLQYQKTQLETFLADLGRQNETLDVLKREVNRLEQESLDRRLKRSDIFPSVDDQQMLMAENQSLRMEVHLLNCEIRHASNSPSPINRHDSEEKRFQEVIQPGQFNPPHLTLPTPQNQAPRQLKPTRPPPLPPRPHSAQPNNPDPEDGEGWSCSACTFLNHPLLNRCECCEMPKLPVPSASR